MRGLIPPPDPAPAARFREALARQHPVDGDTRLGVAVSGGPDSLALLLLAHATLPGRIEVATVDHALRPESADEAAMVAGVCARLGVPHAILRGPWNSDAKDGLQAAARAYRYRELGDWCARRRLPLLATAHHADDQAETLLMRLARGSGLSGLSAIRPVRDLAATFGIGDERTTVRLVRPLLDTAKAELVALVAAAGLVAVDDRSNVSERFDRTRARRLLADTPWLRPERLATAIAHLAEAEAALAWTARREFLARVEAVETPHGADRERQWHLDPAGLPAEILRRVVDRLIRRVEDHAVADYAGPDPEGPALARFIARLQHGETATMWNVLARPGPRWRFCVAPPRRN